MAIKASPIFPDKKCLVQKIVDNKGLVKKIQRDPKGHTNIINPKTGK